MIQSGPGPIGVPSNQDETLATMSTTVRYTHQAQDGPGAFPPAESRMTKMNEIRERLERDQYEIDAQAIAQALVERLLAGRGARHGCS